MARSDAWHGSGGSRLLLLLLLLLLVVIVVGKVLMSKSSWQVQMLAVRANEQCVRTLIGWNRPYVVLLGLDGS